MVLEVCPLLMLDRFMSDKIMPMTEAVEGYELFDKAKVQKGSSHSQSLMAELIAFSCL